ncbi:MAG: hypothetical protein KGL39_04465 [Patescibacteria group bacterium]|nr:hypothetical protein [Patescibacteria group bacterium]
MTGDYDIHLCFVSAFGTVATMLAFVARNHAAIGEAKFGLHFAAMHFAFMFVNAFGDSLTNLMLNIFLADHSV